MKHFLLPIAAAALMSAATANANPRTAILIGYDSPDAIDNFQEEAACKMFLELNPDGKVITPSTISDITVKNLSCIWIHIDRVNIGLGWDKLPQQFRSTEMISALKQFVADGGCLYLSKQATQLLVPLDRIDAAFAPGIYGDGDGGPGTDNWTLQAQIGYWFVADPASDHYDPSQYYDRRNHAIYNGMTESDDFAWKTYPLLGSGNGTELHREDHNCMWDLNAYSNIYTAEGKNTVEKFEAQTNSTVLGQWGHVQDHAVAGVIEFLPENNLGRAASAPGRIIANGLAAYELSPRSGVNAFTDNIRKLTDNTISYLASKSTSGVEEITVDNSADAPAVYFNLQGVQVDRENAAPGIYIMRKGDNVSKIIIK